MRLVDDKDFIRNHCLYGFIIFLKIRPVNVGAVSGIVGIELQQVEYVGARGFCCCKQSFCFFKRCGKTVVGFNNIKPAFQPADGD